MKFQSPELHQAFHRLLNRFIEDLRAKPKRKRSRAASPKKKTTMQKVYDFECDTCGKVFEQMISANEKTIPCCMGACGGAAKRKLGGKPKRTSQAQYTGSSESQEPSMNMGEVECVNRVLASKTLGEREVDGQTVKYGVALIEHTHKPKTQA